MDLFEKKLEEKMELVGKDIKELTISIEKKLNNTLKEIEKQQVELINNLSSQLTGMLDTKLNTIFNSLETKVGSEKTFQIIDGALEKLGKLKLQEKFQTGKNKDLLEYIKTEFEKEQIEQTKKITIKKASDNKITKKEFEDINELLSSLIEEN